jgi:hypothetical protein
MTRFSADNLRTLTPVNGLTRYSIPVKLGDRVLEPDDIQHRYGIPANGEVGLAPEALQAVVEHRERPIPLTWGVIVRLHTRRADGTGEIWLWPQQ